MDILEVFMPAIYSGSKRKLVKVLLPIFFFCLGTCVTKPKNRQVSADGVSSEKLSTVFQIAFYNVENLFDTLSQLDKKDDDFTPEGLLRWNTERYNKKLADLAAVFDSMDWPSIIGLAEVENAKVLNDLRKNMRSLRHYEQIHFESPDDRGIDVALLYDEKTLRVISEHALPVKIKIDTAEVFTRDILYVALVHDALQDTFHVFVNHWPSRVGGKQQTAARRMSAAQVLRNAVEGLWSALPGAKIVIMGDFNDTPQDESILYLLNAQNNQGNQLVNLSYELSKKGKGSYNYRGNWDMLDQIIVCEAFRSTYQPVFEVFDRRFLQFEHDRFGWTPNRTYGGPNYYGGYSDHLPVRILIKE